MLNPKKTKKKRQYLRNNMTKWEIRLWNDLKQKKMLGYKVRRQYGVKNYVIDFYCPELKLGIEVDGDIHFQYGRRNHDHKKDKLLKDLGIKIVRLKTIDFEEDYNSCIRYLEVIFRNQAKKSKYN
ncbi:MAG: DUF559 domain-containing protein [Bacteroidetes bacterium]|jgi:very-short-patch-repair endonuclease|nr:DUF559 domain-containing protein [Bacteroidota bacterium]